MTLFFKNARTGFRDPQNPGKDTNTDVLSQILSKIKDIEDLALLAQAAILFFVHRIQKLLKCAEVACY